MPAMQCPASCGADACFAVPRLRTVLAGGSCDADLCVCVPYEDPDIAALISRSHAMEAAVASEQDPCQWMGHPSVRSAAGSIW